jgi:hypothetical protein
MRSYKWKPFPWQLNLFKGSKNLYFLENEAEEFGSDLIDAGDSGNEVLERWESDEVEADYIIL